MKIYVDCNFCNSSFDTKECKGICPSCGARYSRNVELKVREIKEEKNNIFKELGIDFNLNKIISLIVFLLVFITSISIFILSINYY